MASEYGARLRSLKAREAAEFLGLDRNLLPEADLVSGTAQEGDTVGVERLVNGGSTRLSAGDRNAAGRLARLLAEGGLVTLAQVLDDRGLHCELNQVHGQEPNNVLYEGMLVSDMLIQVIA